MTDDMQRAREFLADALRAIYPDDIARRYTLSQLADSTLDMISMPAAIRAITAALRDAPEGFVMVKASALDGIRTAAEACWAQSQDKSFAEWVRDDAKGQARGLRAALSMLAARPGAPHD